MTDDQQTGDVIIPEVLEPGECRPDSPDAMTVLKSVDGFWTAPRLTKEWYQFNGDNICTSYPKATYFDVCTIEIRTFEEFAEVLAFLKNQPYLCVIRGGLLPGGSRYDIRRTSNENKGVPPTFGEYARRWIILDFDDFKRADFPDPLAHPVECMQEVLKRLPACLQGVACFFSFSGSTGMKPEKLGVHIWFLLEIPLGRSEARAFIRGCEADVAMSVTVQVHYTASPIFIPPLADPLPQRYGTIDGIERIPADAINDLVKKGEELLRPKPQPVVQRSSFAAEPRKTVATSKATSYPAAPVPEGMIGDGHRHEQLKRLAGFARSRGLERDGLDDVLHAENRSHFSPPLDDREPSNMATSFARYKVSDPPTPDRWRSAIKLVAGMMRHGACREALLVGAEHLTKDEAMAERAVESVESRPIWLRDVLEMYPEHCADPEAKS